MSKRTRFFASRIVLLFFLAVTGIYSSNSKDVLERLRYLEIKINTESKFRDDDFLGIIERLDEIDRNLNKTLENRINREEYIEKSTNNEYSQILENLKSGYSRMRTAFTEEKYQNQRIRRQIPKLENNITSVKTDLQKYCVRNMDKVENISVKVEESAEWVKSELATQIEKANISIQETVQELSVKVAESAEFFESEMITKTEKAYASIQETVQKLSANQEVKLLEVSEKVENITLLVMDLSSKFQHFSYQSIRVTCLDFKNRGNNRNGIYKLHGEKVYCDQTTDGGGWIVFQRRLNGAVDFYRKWDEYKTGFGDINGEFWLGNELLSILTADGDHELRIDMEDFEGNKAYAKYSKFSIGTEDNMYRLEVGGYSGNAGDSLTYHNGMPFSTSDIDNDKYHLNCAQKWIGSWWYNACHYSNLNGKYYNEAGKVSHTGITWYHWKQQQYCLKTVEMKFR